MLSQGFLSELPKAYCSGDFGDFAGDFYKDIKRLAKKNAKMLGNPLAVKTAFRERSADTQCKQR